MARRRSFRRPRAGSVRRRLLPHRRALRVEPLEARLCLSVAQLVGHWPFDDAADSDTIVDTAGDFDGMKTNGGPATGVAGVLGLAADFAGGLNNDDNEFVDLGEHAAEFGMLSTGTISAWIKPQGLGILPDRLTIFSVSNSDAFSEEMTFAIDNGANAGKLSYIVRDGATLGNVTSSSSDLLDGQWHHVAVTVGAGDMVDIYIDGNLEDSNAIPFLSALDVDSSAIGRNKDNTRHQDNTPGGGQWFFRGLMDDVGLWDNALTGNEVKALVSLAQHVQLNYDLGQAEQLFDLSDTGGVLTIGGRTWTATMGLIGDEGEVFAQPSGALALILDGELQRGVRSPLVPFVVTSTADFGPGTLRAMIDQANSVPGADTITFDASVDGGTVLMNLGEMVITDALTIDATSLAGGFTLDAQQNSRIFDINGGANNFDVTFAGLALTRGQMSGNNQTGLDHTFSGGAIRSLTTGVLNIEQSTIADSQVTGSRVKGGGAFTLGDVNLTDSTVSGNSAGSSGGGIYARFSDATLTRSTISGNSAAGLAGGGIFADDVMLTQSTVSGNSAQRSGGGISAGHVTLAQSTVSGNSAEESGGGIFAGTVTLTQSTVSGNSAGSAGGGIDAAGSVTLTHSTVSGNTAEAGGGGIYADSNVMLTGSLVAGNTCPRGPDMFTYGAITAEYSLIGDGSDATITDIGGSLIGTSDEPIDPLLGSLADNGGPTLTHALLPNSPAVDAGEPNIVFDPDEFDQRGAPWVRVFDSGGGARIDMGAYERQTLAPELFVVTTALDELDFANDDVSLREAIELVSFNPGAETIVFDPSLSGGTIELSMGQMTIADEVTIDATGLAAPVEIDAQHNSRIFDINGGANNFDVTLAGLTLTRGQSMGDNDILEFTFNGGAIRSLITGDLTIEHTSITDSNVVGDRTAGGGIFALGNITLADSSVRGNSAEGFAFGGGIFTRSDATLTQSTVSGNSAAHSGGGIYARGDVMLDRSTVSGNSAGSSGGGVFNTAYNQLTIVGSTISGNSAAQFGGGIFTSGITIRHSTITGNASNSEGSGGGIYVASHFGATGADLDHVILAGNTAKFSADITYGTARFSIIGSAALADFGGNQFGTPENPIDPLLGPLADNGGPTQTHALLPGSPAIDAGEPNFTSPPNFDQRGAPYHRVTDGDGDFVAHIDIGAVESLGLRNPSFEDGGGSLDAWPAFNNAGVDGSIAVHGSHSARVANHPAGFSGIFQGVPIQGGELLVASVQTWVDSVEPIGAGNFGELKLEFFSEFGGGDLLGQQIVFTADDTAATDTWRQTTLMATAPAGAVEARVVATFVGNSPGALYYDALSLREVQVIAPSLPGDYNENGAVDAADYVLWRKTLGQTDVTPFSGADGNGDGEITPNDYGVWAANFGNTLPPPAASAGEMRDSNALGSGIHSLNYRLAREATDSTMVLSQRTRLVSDSKSVLSPQTADLLLATIGMASGDADSEETIDAAFGPRDEVSQQDDSPLAVDVVLADWAAN